MRWPWETSSMVQWGMTKRQLRYLTSFLLDVLNLSLEGWVVKVERKPHLSSAAACTWEPGRRYGLVALWPAKKLREDLGGAHEFRRYPTAFTLLHELLHIRLEGHLTEPEAEESPTRSPHFEWALDQIATTILRGLLADPLTISHIPKG